VPYPFELDWMEGAMVDHVARLLSGKPIYGPPSIEFVPFIYNPLFYAVSAAVASVTHLGFMALRLVSLAATLATFAFVFEIVRRETGALVPSVLAMGLYALTYPLTGAYFDLGRIDALAVALCLATVLVARWARTRRGYIGTAVLLGLSFAARQNALPLLPALWFHFARERGNKQALWFAMPALSLVLGGVALLNSRTGGWYLFYAFELPLSHSFDPRAKPQLGMLPLLVAAAFSLQYFRSRRANQDHARRFYLLISVALGVMSLSGILHSGGFFNEYMPIYAALCITFGLGFAETVSSSEAPRERALLWSGASAFLFIVLSYDPRPYAPTSRDLDHDRKLLSEISSHPGDVLIPPHGYVATMAGKHTFAHEMALTDVMRGPTRTKPIAARLAADFASALAHHRFGAVILDGKWTFQDLTNTYYRIEKRYMYRSTHYFYHEGDYAQRARFTMVPKATPEDDTL
jgi:hypothetical protein